MPVVGCRRRASQAFNWRDRVPAAAIVFWWGREGAVGAGGKTLIGHGNQVTMGNEIAASAN